MLTTIRAATVGATAIAVLAALSWSASAVLSDAVAALAPGGSLDAMLGALALVLAWAIAAWLTCGVLLAAGAALPGALGRRTASLAGRVSPASVRKAVALAIGVSALVPIAATSATASTGPDPGYPVLDRVVVQPAPAAGPSLLDSAATFASSPSPPGVDVGLAPVTAVSTLVEVRPGDSLWRIAASSLGPDAAPSEIATEWPRWYAENRDLIGDDPGLIRPGQELRPPVEASTSAGS